MKLNLGSGLNKKNGYINVDKVSAADPDLLMDLEVFPWKFDSDSVDEILLNHVLEHLGQETNVFLEIIKEMYRVCKADATIQINVPHPRHDNFLNDPTHVRVVTPDLLGLFSKRNCRHWKEIGASNSPLALYLDVDFHLVDVKVTLEDKYIESIKNGRLGTDDIAELVRTTNNVASEFRLTLKVVK